MSSESIIVSAESEKRWVLGMEKAYNSHIIVDMPFCVYKVPKKLAEEKPEAYAPRRLGLGPLHHLRPDLHSINNQKLVAIAKFLPPEKFQNLRLLVDELIRWEPVIRVCYDQFLDLDIKTLAWIIAVDGLYLLQFLKNYPEMKDAAGDVLMLENQIPMLLLRRILQVFKLIDDDWLLRDFDAFVVDQSPLQLQPVEDSNFVHLLHRMYYQIVNNRGKPPAPAEIQQSDGGCLKMSTMQLINDGAGAAQFLDARGLSAAGAVGQILSFVSAIPWEKIMEMFKKDGSDPSTSADEIYIPSVSQMAEIAGIRFVRTDGGIRDVRFDEDEKTAEKKFYLPWIRITATTEIVLRNLVAFEALTALPGATLELAEYVDLMCGIIDTRRDVEILRKAGIVLIEDGTIFSTKTNGKNKKYNDRRENLARRTRHEITKKKEKEKRRNK